MLAVLIEKNVEEKVCGYLLTILIKMKNPCRSAALNLKINNFLYLSTDLIIESKTSSEEQENFGRVRSPSLPMQSYFKKRYFQGKQKNNTTKRWLSPIVTFAMVITVNSLNALHIFERKILRKTYGLIQERGEWRIQTIKELMSCIQTKI